MAFGIPGSEPTGGGQFLGRIQYDTRVGFWQIVKRVQDGGGNWIDDKSEQFKNPTMLFDLPSLEVGYIKFASPPAFLVVPYGQPIPPQPQEMQADATGKQRKSFLPGFRLKVMSSKTFGDAEAYYFCHNAKTVMEPMDDLYQLYQQAPEAAAGQAPLVAVTGTRIVEIKNTQGTNRYHAPVFQIVGWVDRPDILGPRTVPAPAARAPVAPAAAPAPVTIATMPQEQVAAMAAASVPQQSAAKPAAGMPFAPQVD